MLAQDSGSSEDSDSEEEAPVKTALAKGTPSKPSQTKLINTTATPKVASTGKKAESSDTESSDDSDSDEEAPDSTVLAKGPPTKPSQPPPSKQGKGNLGNLTKPFQAAPTPAKPAAAKKAASSESASNTILPKGVPNKTNQLTPNRSTAALKVPAVAVTQDSSSSESSDETDSEKETPTKKVVTAQPKALQVKAKAAAKMAEPAKRQSMSNGCTPGQEAASAYKVSAAVEHVGADAARGESSEDSSSSEEEEASQSLLAPKPPPKKSSTASKKTPAEKGKREKVSVPSASKTPTNVTPASPWTVTKMTPVVPPTNELDSDVTDIEGDPRASASKVVAATSKGKKGVKSGDLAADARLAKASSNKKTPPTTGSSSEAATPLTKPKRGKDKGEHDTPKPKKKKIGSPELSKAVVPPPIRAAGGDSESDSDSSLDVEKWKRLALHLTESDIAKMDAIASVDLGSPAISVLGKTTKVESKAKEKDGKAKAGGKQSHGTASGAKKVAPPTSAQLAPSVMDDQSAKAKAKPTKRSLITATSAQYGHKTPEKKQKLDDTKQTTSEEKRKDVKEKKNKQQKEVDKRKEGTADVNLPPAAAKLSLLPEEKAAKKNKLKVGKQKNLTSTPSKTLQNDSRDAVIQSPLSDSGQKKKKKNK
ncbi:nucleolar protein dao-5-like [Brienomyrus brachyistius]|uniref:nucleolar protein dao-5-like n=1 Tax=Brienomyrus brachyistius TaxID=42636 RepID=UPI0020B313A9|nr:nucleolar protein dao-5-like [Brienomyrus brachyistius]